MPDQRRRRPIALAAGALVATLAATLLVATSAGAGADESPTADVVWAKDMPGVQHLEFEFGPIDVEPGQNNIDFAFRQVPKPDVDGFIVGIRPNITYANGKVPPVDVVHLHHGVWLNVNAEGDGSRGFPNFFAAGEEKTELRLPAGYGYPYRADDRWAINYMIHDLTSQGHKILITYDIDFVPATAPEAKDITPAVPIWMDVQPGVYPVFDVLKGSGENGRFTYPDQADDPYKGGPPRNVWKLDRDVVLLTTAGHLHPGGLHTDLWVEREGAVGAPGSSAVPDQPGVAHLFRSDAKYFEPAGAVSWDVSMTSTRPDWKVQLRAGDTLRVNATYDSERASWYESMGIMVVWVADDTTDGTEGRDPFTTKVDQKGTLTHGHLPENDNHGGKEVVYPDATKFDPVPASAVDIGKFVYRIGDMTGRDKTIPQVAAGESITYTNLDAPYLNGIWHTITSCKQPCNKQTGIAYPLADGDVQFDSGQLGDDGPPTAGTVTWSTPPDLPAGTYTYFCRIHPFMRGAFKIGDS